MFNKLPWICGMVASWSLLYGVVAECSAQTREQIAAEARTIASLASRLDTPVGSDLASLGDRGRLQRSLLYVSSAARMVQSTAQRDTVNLAFLDGAVNNLERDVMAMRDEIDAFSQRVEAVGEYRLTEDFNEIRRAANEILDRTSRLGTTVRYLQHEQRLGRPPTVVPFSSLNLPSQAPDWNEYPRSYWPAYGEVLGE